LSQPYCIRRIPAQVVVDAADELESGRVKDRCTMILEPDRLLLSQIGKESSQVARQRMAQITLLGRQVNATQDELVRERERGDERVRAREEWSDTLETRIQELRGQTSDLRERISSRDRQIQAAEAKLAEVTAQLERERADLAAQREQLGAQLARERTEHRRGLEEERRLRDEQVRDMELKSGELAADRAEAVRERDDLRSRVDEVGRRIRSLESDREALTRLCEQQENEKAVLRSHLDDLLASRWRKLGQRVGIAMTLPWEREEREHAQSGVGLNGSHGGGGNDQA
jgi:chromosome segregation ATPase